MHPINRQNFGVSGLGMQFYNGSAVVTGYIVKQTGTNRFVVSDGVTTKKVKLAQSTGIASSLNTNPTFSTMLIEPLAAGKGAAFVAHYKVSQAAYVSAQAGSVWSVADSLALPSGTGALTVATVSGNNIATVTVGTAGDYTSLLASPTTVTRAAGTGGTFTPSYGVLGVTLQAPGTGYAATNVLTLTGTGSATVTVDTVDGSGRILTFHLTAPGSATTITASPLAVTGGAGTGATFNATYKILSIASSGGSGYNVGDTLVFTGIAATTTPTATITTATSHAATATTVGNPGVITAAPSAVATNPTTAVFRLGYQLLSMTVSGGTGYNVNDPIVFGGMVATTHPTAVVSTVSSGAATGVGSITPGTNITVAANNIVVGAANEFVKRIWDTKARTTAGHYYKWTRNTSTNGSAIIKDVDY